MPRKPKDNQAPRPSIGFTLDKQDSRKCSACGSTSYKVIGDDRSRLISFVLPVLEILDLRERKGIELKETFTVFLYSCTNCKHLDFYGIEEMEIPR